MGSRSPASRLQCGSPGRQILSLAQAENDRVFLGGDDGGFLPIEHAGGLVAIFGEQDLHVLESVDGTALGHGCARYGRQRTLICEEMRHNDVIDALRTSSRHGHDGGGIFGHEGPPDVVVGQVTLGTEDHVLLHAVQLLLRRLGVADEVQEPGIVLVHYTKLLIKEVFDGVPGMKGVSVVDDGGGRRHPAGFGVERLLLMLVPSKDHHVAQVQPVERGGHGIEGGRGDHAGFVDDHQVVFIQAVVHLVTKRGIHGDVERTVQHVGVDVGQEDFVVALGSRATGAATRTDISFSTAK